MSSREVICLKTQKKLFVNISLPFFSQTSSTSVFTVQLSQSMRKSKATEALHVAQEIGVIRAALKKCGYYLRKQPKQPVWTVYITPDSFYRLTYQPAPISSWVLHPQTNDSSRHTLVNIIQGALTLRPADISRKVS
jgi:hypothetical protein